MVFNRITRILLAALVAPILWAGGALAYEQGTLEEAQAMAERAAAYFHAQGADAAFEAFNSSPDFHDRDLYVFAIGMDGVMAAHGANTNLVGRNVLDLRDPSGRLITREKLAIEDTGWVDYQWQNPQSGNVEPKSAYVINTGDFIIAVGAYH